MKVEIFYSQGKINLKILAKEYSLETVNGGKLKPPSEAYNKEREQFNAPKLLNFLLENKTREIALWLLSKDLYTGDMNFIFGLAMRGQGAILSTYRLDSKKLIQKEALHEVGHILGLEHCQNDCVMKFSNSLREAKQKPAHLCEECKKKLTS